MIREDYECEVGVGLEIALNILFSLLPEFGFISIQKIYYY